MLIRLHSGSMYAYAGIAIPHDDLNSERCGPVSEGATIAS